MRLAETIVAEMTALGAVFEIEPLPGGETFVWFAKPANQRDAIAGFWDSIDKPPGLREAMTQAIRRRQAGGAL